MLSTREWRRNRDRASILLGLVLEAGNTEEAWRVYRKWASAEIDFKEAKRLLSRLAGKAQA